MSKLRLKYYIEFSELVDREAVTNMSEEEAAKFKREVELRFHKILEKRTGMLADVEDFKLELDLEEV